MPVVSRLSTAPVKGTALHHHQKPQSRSLCTSTGKRAAELCGWVKHCSAWWAPCLVALSLTKTPDSGKVNFNTLKAIVGYRGELATDLSTPVEHLPDNGKVIFGMYATVEEPGEVSLGDRVELAEGRGA